MKKRATAEATPVPIKDPALYAVVPRGPAAAKKKAAVVAMPKRKTTPALVRAERNAEHRTKQAIDQVHEVLNRLEARVAHYAKEQARLQRRKQLAEARIERLEDAILSRMEGAALRKADGWKIAFECKPCPASVVIDDEKAVPAEFLRQPKTPPQAPDKLAIKAAIEREITVPGARLVQRLTLVRK